MKAFIIALLALPAALAAPAAIAGSFKSQECTCMNAAGNTRASGICQMLSGQLNGPEEWCHRATAWAPEMDTVFTDQGCVEQWGAEWSKGVCRTTTLCAASFSADYYVFC